MIEGEEDNKLKECNDQSSCKIKANFLFPDRYTEKYAILCLNDMFDLDLISRRKKYGEDKPDLISENEKIGVEVTQALSQDECRLNKLFQYEYDNKNKNEQLKANIKYLKIYNKVKFIEGVAITEKDFSANRNIEAIINSINIKLDKLNRLYHIYDSNRLFLFVDCFEEDIMQALKQIKVEKGYKHLFDIIYLFNNGELYVYKDGSVIDKLTIKKNYKRLLVKRGN